MLSCRSVGYGNDCIAIVLKTSPKIADLYVLDKQYSLSNVNIYLLRHKLSMGSTYEISTIEPDYDMELSEQIKLI